MANFKGTRSMHERSWMTQVKKTASGDKCFKENQRGVIGHTANEMKTIRKL
jgi:hypothetical protein